MVAPEALETAPKSMTLAVTREERMKRVLSSMKGDRRQFPNV